MNSHAPIIFILTLSISIQAAAAIMAFRLIGITGRRAAWSLIAAALTLMAVRRVVPLYRLMNGDVSISPDPLNEIIGLALSAAMAAGIAFIAPLFIERKQREEALAERVMLAELSVDIGSAMAKQDDLRIILDACAEALVRHLDAAFARIWTLNAAEDVLEMQASAGMYPRTDGSHQRIPVGKFKIGLIAEERKPHITNAVIGDPRVHDQEWAKREGMVAFAGHPLTIGDKLVGVMGMFSRHPLSEVTLKALAAVSSEIAVGIDRNLAEKQLHRLNRQLRAISDCNQTLMRAEEEQSLLADICRIVCDEAGYRMAWVGYAENDEPGTIRPVAWAGVEEGYLEQARLTGADMARDRGPGVTDIAIDEGICIQDISTNPQAAPWRDLALQRGYRSGIALPLKDESKNMFGILSIYSAEPMAFTPDETRLMEELAGDLAFGIMVLRARSERKRTEQERLDRLRFVESMDQINRAIQGTNDLEKMMSDVLDAVLEIFDCDRAWLLYPCDPEAASWSVPMERTKPEYPGANVQGRVLPMDPEVQRMFRIHRGTDSPISWGPGSDYSYPEWLTKQFGVQSQLSVAAYPKTGQPWQFGMHQCSYARRWTPEEEHLFQAIGRRLADALSSLLSYHDLTESEAKYRRFVDTSNEGIWMLGEDLLTAFVNPKMADLLGYNSEEMIGRPVTDFMFEEDISDHHGRMENRRRGLSEHYECRYRHKNGQPVWTLVSAVPIRDAEQNFKGTFAMFTDVSERKQAVEILREREAFIRNILDSVDEGFIVVDRQYRILSVNRAFCRMMQVPEDQVLGRPCYEISHQMSRPCFEQGENCAVRRSFESGKAHTALHSHADSSGVKHHMELKAFPLSDGDGTVVSVIETLNDVTEKVKLEEQLRQAQKMEAIGTLAGGVSHDFNNMLSVIIGHAEMALRKVDPADPFSASLQEIRKAAGRSADLTRQLLAFARKQTVVPKVLDLNVTLEGMLKMLRRLIGEDIDLAWLPGSGLWPVLVDPSQIDQILANLCVNARDAVAGVGKVTIETRNAVIDEGYCADHPEAVAGDYLLLSVSDNGCGMDRLTADRVFEPFFTTKELGKGTGLGLATVYGIAKQNNGFVNVYSEPGHGSTFNVYLPRHDAKIEEIPQESQALPMARGHECILLVEDEAAILEMTRQFLEELGYRVLAASRPAEAIRLAKERPGEIRLLLTDVVMPEMNGQELSKILLALFPEIRPLFMSGYAGSIIQRHGELDEGYNFIQKPFSIRALAAKIREVLDTE
jgi:PAS domain S-box-containing protein